MHDFLKLMAEQAELRVNESKQCADFCSIFNKNHPAIIAEIKFASPTHPNLYTGNLTVTDIAKSYLAAGADAISILTEPHYFAGNLEYISAVHQQFPSAPLLMKDFIVDEKQIIQAKKLGASAVLLIVDLVDPQRLQELNQFALEIGLTPIIEVHQHAQLDIALTLDPKVILINQRNLTDLSIDYVTSTELIKLIPESIHVICASGITRVEQINELTDLGFAGFLIGSSLMRDENPGVALAELMNNRIRS